MQKHKNHPSTSEKDKSRKSDQEKKSLATSGLSNSDNSFTPSPNSAPNLDTMPVPGGVPQGQNPTQGLSLKKILFKNNFIRKKFSFSGLVHWMSAVMAEHMTSNTHHDSAVGMHYMWNGAVDVNISIFPKFLLHTKTWIKSQRDYKYAGSRTWNLFI